MPEIQQFEWNGKPLKISKYQNSQKNNLNAH